MNVLNSSVAWLPKDLSNREVRTTMFCAGAEGQACLAVW